jgi:hypothetical protein
MKTPQPVTEKNLDSIPIPCWGLVEYWGGAKPGRYWNRYTHAGDLIADKCFDEFGTVSFWLPDQKEAPTELLSTEDSQ